MVVRYGMTALYMVERPGMRPYDRFLSWLLITPLEAIPAWIEEGRRWRAAIRMRPFSGGLHGGHPPRP
jgi:hypothetical protein